MRRIATELVRKLVLVKVHYQFAGHFPIHDSYFELNVMGAKRAVIPATLRFSLLALASHSASRDSPSAIKSVTENRKAPKSKAYYQEKQEQNQTVNTRFH